MISKRKQNSFKSEYNKETNKFYKENKNKVDEIEDPLSEFLKDKKYPDEYTNEIETMVKLLTIKGVRQKINTIYGSYSSKGMLFASDVDVMTEYSSYKEQIKQIPEIVKYIKNLGAYKDGFILFGDCKFGRDAIGDELVESVGKIKNCDIIEYNPDKLKELIKTHYNYIKTKSEEEIPEIPEKENITLKQWLKIYKFAHGVSVIRWKPDEITKRQKNNISFSDAVSNSDLNKIDTYCFIDGKFKEITMVYETKEFDKPKVINAILTNAWSYLFSDTPNYLKVLKRMMSVAKMSSDLVFINRIRFFLNGNIGLLSSIYSDLDLLNSLNKYNYDFKKHWEFIDSHLGNIITRLSNVFEVKIKNEYFLELKKLQQAIRSIRDNKIKEFDFEKLNKLINNILTIINFETLHFIRNNNIDLNIFCKY
jgi:hypothetical protein